MGYHRGIKCPSLINKQVLGIIWVINRVGLISNMVDLILYSSILVISPEILVRNTEIGTIFLILTKFGPFRALLGPKGIISISLIYNDI